MPQQQPDATRSAGAVQPDTFDADTLAIFAHLRASHRDVRLLPDYHERQWSNNVSLTRMDSRAEVLARIERIHGAIDLMLHVVQRDGERVLYFDSRHE